MLHYLDSLIRSWIEILLWSDKCPDPVVLRREIPYQLAGLNIPDLDALERAAIQLVSVDGKSADGVLMSGHGRHHLQRLHVPHLDAVVHWTTEQKLLSEQKKMVTRYWVCFASATGLSTLKVVTHSQGLKAGIGYLKVFRLASYHLVLHNGVHCMVISS